MNYVRLAGGDESSFSPANQGRGGGVEILAGLKDGDTLVGAMKLGFRASSPARSSVRR